MSNTKKLILGLLFIIIIAGAAYASTRFAKKSNTNSSNGQEELNQPQGLVKKTEVETDKSPEKFPTNVPIEEGATITQNYNATAPDGRFQATRVFETKKTLAENLKLYTDYLKNNGWKTTASIDQSTYKMVMGSKGNQQLQISIDENSATKVKTVSINLTEIK